MSKLALGQVVQTSGVAEAAKASQRFYMEVQQAFNKYMRGDWGDTCQEDAELNNQAVENNERVVAKYKTSEGDIFIITEWDRSYTTILFANEY